ncbi:MAG: hypothetical protein HZB91_07265 [Elusimicrobia bacterium]|nr:hypothetical protein [Elusimicrobiota bacterium]
MRRVFYNLSTAAVLLAGCGCMSQLVETAAPRQSSVAGVGWIDFGKGEFKYALDSWGWVTSLRRRAALRRARRFCEGRGYKIVREFEKEEMAVPYASSDLTQDMVKGVSHYKVHPFQHIVFECSSPPHEIKEDDAVPAGTARPVEPVKE